MYGCNIEVLSIDTALATYNFIINEQHLVAEAFIPPKYIPVNDDDVITANNRHVHVHGEEVHESGIWTDDEERTVKINLNYNEFS